MGLVNTKIIRSKIERLLKFKLYLNIVSFLLFTKDFVVTEIYLNSFMPIYETQ